jgi:hypothetical protein
MWPYAIPFCVVRIAEMRPVLIAVALHRDFDMAKAGALRVVDCGDHCWRNSFGLPERPARSPLSGWRHMFDAYDEVEVVARGSGRRARAFFVW